MGSMYERIAALCAQNGIKPGKLCADTGLSRGLLSDLKNGRTKSLSAKNARIIAEYFDVSVGWLLGEAEAPRPVTDADIKFALFGGDGEITDEMYLEVRKFAAYLKQTKQGS